MSPEFLKELESLIIVRQPVEIEYRLHYQQDGFIYMCTMTDHPEGTQYLVVSKEEYDRYFDYTVHDGRLKKIDRDPGYRVQLKKSPSGVPTVAGHAGLVIEPGEEYLNVEHYDRKTHS